MKTKTLCSSFIFFIICHLTSLAQVTTSGPRLIDSLKKAFITAKEDTTKIKLRLEIGQESWLVRVGYWDSLAKDAKAHNLYLTECTAISNLSYIYLLQNDTSNFIKCLNKSLKIAEEHSYSPMLLVLLTNLGNHYIITLQLRKGLNTCFKGLKLAEKLKDKKAMANFNSLISKGYWTIGDFHKALGKRLENLKIYTELKDSINICGSLLALGDTYEMLGDLDKTSEHYLEGLKFYRSSDNPRFGSLVYNAVGAAYKIKHQYDSASFYFDKAYKIAESLGHKSGMAGSLTQMADNNYLKGNNDEAKKQAVKAMELCKTTNFRVQIPTLALILKKIYLKDKNYIEALNAYEIYVTAKDSISNEKNRKLASQKEFDYEFEKKTNENKLLAQQNQIQSLELSQNKYFLWGMGVLLLLVFVIGYLFMRQSRFKAEQQSSRLEQKLLRSQMNPHFIFNSLQAIQNFILKHDEKEAVRYLSSFATITRNVLENSRMELIPLIKEITLLENYLQLQKLRFKNRFDYEIKVDETIDTENTNIPPMLAQPFIENAVEHGFHDIGGGRITILYTLKNEALIIEISDNGTGMKDGYSESKQHQSLALEITKERVVLMNKKAKDKVVFTISEAFPFEKERKGVKVNFHLPLNLQS